MIKRLIFSLQLLLMIYCLSAQINPSQGIIETTVYLSPQGNDTNNGTINSPLATFGEALFHCPYGINGGHAYSEIVFLNGTYTITEEMRQACWQYQNAEGYKDISLRGIHRDSVILDGSTSSSFAGKFINLLGSGISIKDLTIKLASPSDTARHYAVIDVRSLAAPCDTFSTSNIIIENILIDGSWDHGINITESDSVLIQNVEVRNANLINLNGRNEPGGWGSGIKTRLVNHLEINNARVYHCWGEGIANARTTDAYVHHNEISDNYSVNIYLDNVIGGTYSHNLVYGTIGDSLYWRTPSPSPGFGLATEHYSGLNFDETSDIRIYNNIVLNTQGLYLDDNRAAGEPLGTSFKNIWFCNNSIIGWQGDLNSNLRAIRLDYAGYNNDELAMDSIYLFNNIIGVDSSFISASGNGQLISGSPEALPPTLFYGYNYWAANPSRFSFFNYSHDNQTDSINLEIPSVVSASQLDLIEPSTTNYLIFEGRAFPFIEDDFYGKNRMNTYQVGAIDAMLMTGISVGNQGQARVEIAPNPVTDTFRIKGLSDSYTIRIVDIKGVVCQVIEGSENAIDIHSADLKKGLYFVVIADNVKQKVHVEQVFKK